MITKETIDKISGLLKIDSKTLADAITNEKEIDVEVPAITVFTEAELSSRDSNKYNEGKIAGAEILIKDLKEKNGIEIDGKDPAKFLEAFKTKVLKDVSVEPDKKVEEANKAMDSLRASLNKAESERDAAVSNLRSVQLQSKATSGVEGEYLLSKERILHLMSADGYTLDEENGTVIFKQNGNAVRDSKTQDVLPAGKVFEEFAKTSGLIKTAPVISGRGDKTKTGSLTKPTSMKQLREQWEAEGKSPNSAEFSARAMEAAKDNPDFFNE